ncbi:MAG TPA: hypothetical protein VIO95_16890 [Mycobacterium sp.]
MSDTILYQYGANYDALDGIKQALNDAMALREDVAKVFNALSGVYEGEAATALQTTHQSISQQLDQLILDMQGTQQQAVDRQGLTASQDHQLAGGF